MVISRSNLGLILSHRCWVCYTSADRVSRNRHRQYSQGKLRNRRKCPPLHNCSSSIRLLPSKQCTFPFPLKKTALGVIRLNFILQASHHVLKASDLQNCASVVVTYFTFSNQFDFSVHISELTTYFEIAVICLFSSGLCA